MSITDIHLQNGPFGLKAEAETVTINQVVFNVTFESAVVPESSDAVERSFPPASEATIPAELEELSEDLGDMAAYLRGLVSFLRRNPSAVPAATWDSCPSQPS